MGPKLEGEGNVGDIVLFDSSTKKIIGVSYNSLNISTYPSSRYTPIGVVVIPKSHDVYGTEQCGVVSLGHMNPNDPDNGDGSQSYYNSNIYWGSETPIPDLNCFGSAPIISSTFTSNNIIDWSSFGNFASDHDFYYGVDDGYTSYPLPGYGLDTKSRYVVSSYDYYFPSPFLENGYRNPSYYVTTGSPSYMSGNCLSDFNGKENTELILKCATSQSDWKTASAITHSSSDGYYGVPCCCWRYHTSGTSQGDWYLPAIGELGYLVARAKTIQNSIEKIRTLYDPNSTKPWFKLFLDYYTNYWSSTCEGYSSYSLSMYTVSLTGGDLYSAPYYSSYSARAFIRL